MPLLDSRLVAELEGKKVGKYRVERLVGQGAMGDVYRCSDQNGAAVALKVLAPSLEREEEMVRRFEREGQAATQLEHPNIVRVLEVGAWRGRHYLAMEFLPGQTFRKTMAEEHSPAVLIAALAEVASALAHAHSLGVVHRDIKPENVLLDGRGVVKVVDFGLARFVGVTTLTADGTMLGTADYLSPEQAKGERAGPASDVYSLGVMIYEVATGKLPFVSDTSFGLVYQHASAQPPPPRLRRGYPAALGRLAMRCLVKDPTRRPAMTDVAEGLRDLARHKRRAVSRRLTLDLAALALVGVIGLLIAFPGVLDPFTRGWAGGTVVTAAQDLLSAVRLALIQIYTVVFGGA